MVDSAYRLPARRKEVMICIRVKEPSEERPASVLAAARISSRALLAGGRVVGAAGGAAAAFA